MNAAERAVLQLAADLSRADNALRIKLCETPPATTGDRRFDAYIAALAEHLLVQNGLTPPAWVYESWRTLDEPWDIETVTSLQAAARAVTPPAFARHRVFLDPINLVDV